MENENIRENENIFDDEPSNEEITNPTVESDGVEVFDEVSAGETEVIEETEGLPELTEEELEAIRALKRKKMKNGLIITAVIAAIIAIMAYFVCATEGFGGSTAVNKPIFASETEEGNSFLKALKTDNIKYENPAVAAFEKVTGKNKDIALTINGEKVPKDLFNFVVNSSGINSVYTLVQMQMISDVSGFDWNRVEETSGLSYLELSKGMAMDTLIPIYATIAEGKKNGVVLDDEDEKKITDWVDEQKKNYGDQFEEILHKSGYESEETLAEIQRIQVYMQKVYDDMSKDISKYVSKEVKSQLSDDKVTVKHILVEFEKDETGTVTDEGKAAAKKEAEEVLAKVNNGEDFDKLIEQHNDDPGATAEGYTFANDGSMVQEFADASFALEVGGVSEIVETTYGYHIIKRLERAITADEYIENLKNTVDVRVKKGVYNNINITINLEDYFGVPQTEESTETE